MMLRIKGNPNDLKKIYIVSEWGAIIYSFEREFIHDVFRDIDAKKEIISVQHNQNTKVL